MRRVIADFVEEVVVSGRCSVHVRYCILLFIVDVKCSNGIARAYGGVNEAVAIE